MFPSHEDDNIPSPYDYSDLESDDTDPFLDPRLSSQLQLLRSVTTRSIWITTVNPLLTKQLYKVPMSLAGLQPTLLNLVA